MKSVSEVTSFYLICPFLKLKVCVKLFLIFLPICSKMNVEFPSTILWKEAVVVSIDRSIPDLLLGQKHELELISAKN